MRRTTPRLPALTDEALSEEAQKLMAPMLANGRAWNVFRTMANHPDLMRRWMVFANHVLAKSSLGDREKEMAILRTGWNRQAGYEWAQHIIMGADAGLTEDEIQRIKEGPDAAGWSAFDRLILQATDELCADADIADATWAGLAEVWSDIQLMDLVFAVGQYSLVSMALNAFGVQLDDHLVLDW